MIIKHFKDTCPKCGVCFERKIDERSKDYCYCSKCILFFEGDLNSPTGYVVFVIEFKDFKAIWCFNGVFCIMSKDDIFIFSQQNHPPIDIKEEQLKMMLAFQ